MMKLTRKIYAGIALVLLLSDAVRSQNALVLQSDFGNADGAVAAMKGVAFSVSPELHIFDLTHDIPTFDIWQAAYRLRQTAEYWPSGTVFVSVVDPGVGTARKSVVLKTESGHCFVTPDNGTLTLVAEQFGVAGLREIDEALNRREGSQQSHTFHGRDVYAFTGARLAAGVITFEQVGPGLNRPPVMIAHERAELRDGKIKGGIPILDVRYGNVWTNIPRSLFEKFGVETGDSLEVAVSDGEGIVYAGAIQFVRTFDDVPQGQPLLYINSLDNVALAINLGNFAEKHGVEAGPEWRIVLRPTH